MAESFRIGIALSLFPPVVGGAELLLYELARRWVARGHATTVFTRAQPNAPAVETIDGIIVRRAIKTLAVGPLFGATFVASLTRAIRRNRDEFDILVAFQVPWESAATGWSASEKDRKLDAAQPRRLVRRAMPCVAVLQQSGPFGDLANLAKSRFAKTLKRALLRHDAFVGLSQHAANELAAIGCPTARVRVIRNGIDLNRFGTLNGPAAASAANTVLFVGRFVEQKNPLALLEAWKAVQAAGDYRLLLVGAGELESGMRQFCSENALTSVEFLGRRSDMPAVYRQASVFVLPSLGEGCCMALLESMAGGLCPVVTAVGGNLDVVEHGTNGLLVRPNDPGALATGLLQVLADPRLRVQLGTAAARHIAERHDIDKVADRYLDLFASLLESHR